MSRAFTNVVSMSAECKTIRLLIVEDHKITLDGLKYALASEADIEVIGGAETFAEGYILAQTEEADVILLDLHLPDSPGPRAMIQKFSALKRGRIVVFSGEKRQIFIDSAIEAGAGAYVLKNEPAASVAQIIRKSMIGNLAPSNLIPKEKLASNGRKLRLSEGEKHILRLLAQGQKYQDIADHRYTSAGTVRKQCERLLEKLSLESREQLIAWAVNNGFGGID